jgi:hypothetical protein
VKELALDPVMWTELELKQLAWTFDKGGPIELGLSVKLAIPQSTAAYFRDAICQLKKICDEWTKTYLEK